MVLDSRHDWVLSLAPLLLAALHRGRRAHPRCVPRGFHADACFSPLGCPSLFSPRSALAACSSRAVFEDDVVLADNFTAALSDALAALPEDWDVLLLGALGAVHPLYYGVNAGHALLAGGCRYPRGAAKAFGRDRGGGVAIHTPLRPFGTHAYALSERGAKKLLAAAPRASYHVDVIAWGLRRMKLFAVHPLLAKQTHDDTTIGGHSDRSWLPNMVIDQCTRSR